jgi:phosphomannomutase
MYKVGHAYIKNEMHKTGAVFAGEVSMHFYFSELWNVECTDYAMLLLLKELALSKTKLSELWRPLNKYKSTGEMNYKVKDTNIVLKQVEQYYASKASKVIDIDGIRCEFGDPATDPHAWWFNLRASNTEPLVRLNMEAQSKEELMHHLEELNVLIEQKETI